MNLLLAVGITLGLTTIIVLYMKYKHKQCVEKIFENADEKIEELKKSSRRVDEILKKYNK